MNIDQNKNRRTFISKKIPLIGLMSFFTIAAAVAAGLTKNYDQIILVSLRSSGNLSFPLYGKWLLPVMKGITSLGNTESLTLITIIISFYMILKKEYSTAVILVASVLSASLIDILLKSAFARTRPAVVPHLVAAYYYSFPSGHAFITTVLFSSLEFILLKSVSRRIIKYFTISLTVTVLFLIGFSRVYLGVHYPSDILGGWSAGLFWFSFVWIFSEKIAKYPLEKG